jgi:hypothetical protein
MQSVPTARDKPIGYPGRRVDRRSPREGTWFSEVWSELRPYVVKFSVDLLATSGLWMVLFLFKVLTELLAIPGWAGEFIVHLHAAGAVAAFGLFACLFAVDLWAIRKNGTEKS